MSQSTRPTIGIPREIKEGERRVAGLPHHARRLVDLGCPVVVERGAGTGSGRPDEQYQAAGADLADTPADVYRQADLVWKVKEILPPEYGLLHAGQTIFTYLHAPPRPEMTRVLRDSGCVAIAYEEMLDHAGRRPLLAPMSRMAGAGAVALAAQFSQTPSGGCGKLLFHTEGTEPMVFLILGGGVAGQAAASAALGAGATVHLLETVAAKLDDLRQMFPAAAVAASDEPTIRRLLPRTDVLVNCTFWMPGDPHIITRDMLSLMPPGSLIMDVAADPHGAVETSEATTHDDPLRTVDGIRHYAVPNIPALFARSASEALSDATWPYLERIVRQGLDAAVRNSPVLRRGVVIWRGKVVGADLGRIQGIETLSHDQLLALLT